MLYESNGQYLMDVVLQFFRENHWNVQKLDRQSVFRTAYRGEHGTWVCFIRVDEIEQRVTFYSAMGLNIPQPNRLAVIEYLTRVNYTLNSGNFEMDMDTGDVRFRTSIEAPDLRLSKEMIRRMVYTNVHCMDRYFSGVLAVMHGGLLPSAAFARVEAQILEI